ncbi:MAG: alpha/beta hydrolase [bacterium]|nr:alpha/beta hydrolase [bacterium]
MSTQVVVINGGNAFITYEEYLSSLKGKELNFERLKQKRWRETLGERLRDGFEVVALEMPNRANAKYLEWKIWFEKLIPFLKDGTVFVGHSLGGIFLAKYFSENTFPKKVRATFLVAAPYDEEGAEYLGDFILPGSLDGLRERGGSIFLYHSEDDPLVPFGSLEKYRRMLPNGTVRIFKDKGHFMSPEFPELAEDIKKL